MTEGGEWYRRIGSTQFRFYEHDVGLQIVLKNTKSEDGHVYADLHAYRDYMDGNPPGKILTRPKVNLTSDRAIPGLVRSLEVAADKWGEIKGFDFRKMIEEICGVLVEQMDSKGVITILQEPMRQEERAQPMLFKDILPRGLVSGLIAHGGTGKSMTGLLMALAVMTGRKIGPFEPLIQGPVLYADWENEATLHHRRLTRICDGLGIDFPAGTFIHYAARGKLSSAEGELMELASDKGVLLTVMDSIGFGAGGNLNDTDVATAAMNTMKHLPGTKVMIAHISKASVEGVASKAPIGSVFFWNGPQAVYDLHTTEPAMDGSVILSIFGNKNNVGAKLSRPMGIKVYFEDDDNGGPITPELIEIRGHLEGGEDMSLTQRIADALLYSSSPQTASQVADVLFPADPEPKKAGVQASLRKMRQSGRVVSFGEQGTRGQKGAEQTWALRAPEEYRNVRTTSDRSSSEVCASCGSSDVVAYDDAGAARCRKHKPAGAFD
ncbi:MAG: AAA family ATPase [Gemmatimonadaceae bacterium]|nr:AAA family ATPase [Gemmatimonadaceae bacterium]